MTITTIANLIAISLAALFAASALLHIAAPRFLKARYRNWQYARGFHYVVGFAQGLAALFLAVPETRIWGGFLAAAILFVTTISLLNHGKYFYAVPAILALMTLAPAMAGSL